MSNLKRTQLMQRIKVSGKSFEGQTLYVGIDSHLKSWKVAILGEEYEYKTMSSNPDPEGLAGYLNRNFPGGSYKAVYEAGFSGFKACRILRELGVDCLVVHPADVPTSQRDRQQKTDRVDSRKLARMLRSGEFEGLHLPDPELEADRALVRQRFRIMRDLTRQKNRVKSLLHQFGIDLPKRFTPGQSRNWSRVYMDWLLGLPGEREEIKQVVANYVAVGQLLKTQLLAGTRQVRAVSKKARYARDYHILTGIPGIGPLTAIQMLVQLGDVSRFGSLDRLCAYVGLVPTTYGSGDRMVAGRLSRRGRKELKVMLIEASWVAARKDPALILRFNNLTRRMNKNKAVIRIAKNLLGRIRYLLRTGQEYQPGIIK